MLKYSFLVNSGVWGYEPLEKKMTAVRGHKYHILPVNSSPLTISIAIFFLVMAVVSNLHLTLITNFIDNLITTLITNFHLRTTFFPSSARAGISQYDLLIAKLNSTNMFIKLNNYKLLINLHELYILWFSPFLIFLGLFFLWNSNAIEEGTVSKINFLRATATNVKLVAARIVSSPIFHTNLVWKGFKIGFILFIVSEVMFFFGFFWAFFHSALSPTIQIGAVWPPLGVDFITVKGFAVANTVILLTSGATLTVAHYALELIPLRRIFLYKTKTPWNESQPFFNFDLIAMALDWLRSEESETRNYEWAPAFDWVWIIQFKRYLKRHWATQYYLEYYYRLTPFLMLTNIPKYFFFSWEKKWSEIIAWMYVNVMLNATLILATLFMIFQIIEYFISPVNIDTGIYGSTFYMITGLHGFHVFIGTCFLFYCRTAVDMNWILTVAINAYEISFHHFSKRVFHHIKVPGEWRKIDDYWVSHLGRFKIYDIWLYGKEGIESFECAAWYWHFVDVVWIFVFAFVYVWSHLTVLEQN